MAAPPKEAADYRLVFSDEFDSPSVGALALQQKWFEGVWFEHSHAPRGAFETGASALSLTWTRNPPQAGSTSISTFSKDNPRHHAWRYGYFEARMKWTPVTGAWPAFWLIPVQGAAEGATAEIGEIDIFEGQGAEPRTYFGTLHRWRGRQDVQNTSRHNRFALPAGADFAQYHTYGLLWLPEKLTWYFDGVPLHSEPSYEVFQRQDYFLVLGMQAGVDWHEGKLTGVNADRLTLTVDWVRVWQR